MWFLLERRSTFKSCDWNFCEFSSFTKHEINTRGKRESFFGRNCSARANFCPMNLSNFPLGNKWKFKMWHWDRRHLRASRKLLGKTRRGKSEPRRSLLRYEFGEASSRLFFTCCRIKDISKANISFCASPISPTNDLSCNVASTSPHAQPIYRLVRSGEGFEFACFHLITVSIVHLAVLRRHS